MKILPRIKKLVLILTPIIWLIAIIGLILCLIYSKHHWNSSHFETFYAHWDFFLAYLFESIGLLIFFLLFLWSSSNPKNKRKLCISIISSIFLLLGVFAVIITLIANSIGLSRVIKDYQLDCQLVSDNQELFREAVDDIIPYCDNVRYSDQDPDSYVLKAARAGYSIAQNAMGCFYHERAKIALAKADYENNSVIQKQYITQSENDFDHAIYWFLKAAQNHYAVSQTNLGRIFMRDLASNRFPDIKLAKQWLLKACNLGDEDAFYYLGKIYSQENLRDAYVYWSKGAELGNEACVRELEKPEFAMGIPEDKKIIDVELADSCAIDYGLR